MFLNLKKLKVETMLASADHRAIDEMIYRSRGILDKRRIYHFPTRVDTSLFKPFSKEENRKALNLECNKTLIVSCGRLSWIKGWELILEAMAFLQKEDSKFQIIFVGDGEDRPELLQKAKKLGVEKDILITGFVPNSEVIRYLNAADLCVVASYKEGWSLAMLEMIACGKPVVSTDVSGAKDLIRSGENGFVVEGRNPKNFADAIRKTLYLKNAERASLQIAARYSTKTIASDLGRIWKPLS